MERRSFAAGTPSQSGSLERLATLAGSFGMARELVVVYRALRDFVLAAVPCSEVFISAFDPMNQLRIALLAFCDRTEFDVYLPRSVIPRVDLERDDGGEEPRGSETVLLTEDESAVRRETLRHGVASDGVPFIG